MLVNDLAHRQLLLVDSTFKLISIVADSTAGAANSYGTQASSILPFEGDSTLFIDASSSSMLVIDPDGNIARVMAVPRSQDALMLATGGITGSVFYSKGYLIHRGMPQLTAASMVGSGGAPRIPTLPDTMAIVRVNLKTRVLDTVGFSKTPQTRTSMTQGDDGSISISIETNPLPTIDEWVVTSKGDVAIVRGRDYHVDWMSPDRQYRSTPKIPFDWKRLSDADKAAFIDSVKKLRDQAAAADSGKQGKQMAQAFSSILGGSTVRSGQVMISMRSTEAGTGRTQAPKIAVPVVTFVSPSELPDYQPPFFALSAKPDADGNVWIRTIPTKPEPAGTVYDIINGNGEVTDRVLIPEGRSIVGFGPGGTVYMGVLTGDNMKLERAQRQH